MCLLQAAWRQPRVREMGWGEREPRVREPAQAVHVSLLCELGTRVKSGQGLGAVLSMISAYKCSSPACHQLWRCQPHPGFPEAALFSSGQEALASSALALPGALREQ